MIDDGDMEDAAAPLGQSASECDDLAQQAILWREFVDDPDGAWGTRVLNLLSGLEQRAEEASEALIDCQKKLAEIRRAQGGEPE